MREAQAAVRFLSIEPLIEDLGEFNLQRINWVIVGGESGLGARPMDKSWVLNIREQCQAANVPFFFKQWGGVRKSAAGRQLEGRNYDDMPDRPVGNVAPQKVRLAMIDDVRDRTAEMQLA